VEHRGSWQYYYILPIALKSLRISKKYIWCSPGYRPVHAVLSILFSSPVLIRTLPSHIHIYPLLLCTINPLSIWGSHQDRPPNTAVFSPLLFLSSSSLGWPVELSSWRLRLRCRALKHDSRGKQLWKKWRMNRPKPPMPNLRWQHLHERTCKPIHGKTGACSGRRWARQSQRSGRACWGAQHRGWPSG